jgi:hypothetical protein
VTDGVTDTAQDGTRLHRLLGGEPTAWLVQRARDRLEAGRPLTGTVTLTGATVEQRRAVERLTGRPPRSGTSLSVSLPEVDRVLRESGAAPGGLAEAVALLTGPLRDRSRDRADTASAWAAAFAPLDDAVAGRAELAAWRAWLDATGVVRRLAPSPDVALPLLDQVAAVLRRLPSRGVPIGRLAAECCGDAHALDDGRPAGTLALSAVRALAGLPFAAEVSADSRRTVWASAGVHLDDLSSLVLCLGLPGDSRTALGKVLALHRETGQPAMLTLRQLRCHESRPRRTSSAAAARHWSASADSRPQPDGGWSTCWRRAARSSATTAISTGAVSGSPARFVSEWARDRRAGGRGGMTKTLMRPRLPQHWPGMPPRGCPGWAATRSPPPGILVWRPPWRGTMFASRKNFPSTPCSRTWLAMPADSGITLGGEAHARPPRSGHGVVARCVGTRPGCPDGTFVRDHYGQLLPARPSRARGRTDPARRPLPASMAGSRFGSAASTALRRAAGHAR